MLTLQLLGDQRDHAERFLKTQQRRVAGIEEQLVEATNFILPACPDSKTATELAELVRLVQEASRKKMQLLKARLELMGYDWEEEPGILSPQTPQAEIHWAVGGRLESVVEGDVETEGATTPGSMLQPSPSYSANKEMPLLTPPTPTMDNFSFRYVRVQKQEMKLIAISPV